MILCDCAKDKCYCENLDYVFLTVIILVLIAILIVFIFLTIKIDDEEINNKNIKICVTAKTEVNLEVKNDK